MTAVAPSARPVRQPRDAHARAGGHAGDEPARSSGAAAFSRAPDTVTEALQMLHANGYTADFHLVDGAVCTSDDDPICVIGEAVVERLYRFEGPTITAFPNEGDLRGWARSLQAEGVHGMSVGR